MPPFHRVRCATLGSGMQPPPGVKKPNVRCATLGCETKNRRGTKGRTTAKLVNRKRHQGGASANASVGPMGTRVAPGSTGPKAMALLADS